MTSTFVLRLDRTAPVTPTLAINGGAAYATSRNVTANLTVADTDVTGFLVKIWGDVDLADNPNIQASEGASTYIPYSTAVAVKLSAGDGSKTLTARFRDDVGNATTGTYSDSITLDTTLPTVSITVPFTTGVQAADLTYKISEVAGFDKADGTFQADSDIAYWEIRVVPTTGSSHTAGTKILAAGGSTNTTGGVVDSGTLALAATTNKAVQIDGTDLYNASTADGDKILKVFVQDLAGNWSP